ncbi:MAG: phosphatidylserine decarboxylase family protein [Bacteroidota bacterium]
MIHKEGYKIVFIALIVLAVLISGFYFLCKEILVLFWILSGLATLTFIWVLYFFRNPTRKIEINDNQIISPADGKVVVIEKTIETEYFNDERIQISIFMSPLNVHVNRYPISGEIVYTKYHKGKYLVAWNPKSSTENERSTIVIRMENGKEILVRQIAGIMARRIIPYGKTGDKIKQGEELGFIRFGSRVDLLLPVDTPIIAQLNQSVKGNRDVIAKL